MITTLHVDGMRSVHCVRALFTALGGIAGIARAEVTMGQVVVEHDGAVSTDVLTAAITTLGYAVRDVVHERRRLMIHDADVRDERSP